MSFSWAGYRALTLATLKMQWRNPVGVLVSLGALVLVMAALHFTSLGPLFGYRVALVNNGRTPAADNLVTNIESISYFKVYEMDADYAHLNFEDGAVEMTILIPDSVGLGGTSSLAVSYRPGASSDLALSLLQGAVDRANVATSGATPAARIDFSSEAGSALGGGDLLLPGVIALQLVNTALITSASVFAAYRASGTLRRIQATGVDAVTFVLSHATFSMVIGVMQIAVLLAAAYLFFAVAFDIPAVFGVTLFGFMAFLGLGLAIAGLIRDPRVSGVTASIIGTPLILLGFVPPQLLPFPWNSVLGYLPIDMFTDGLHRAALGSGLLGVFPDLIGLLIWSAVFMLLAGRVFRWDT